MDIDPKTIQPEQDGKSDFFNWQLFRWARKNPCFCEVWETLNGTQYIGLSDVDIRDDLWLYGRRLRNLCCYSQSLERCAYPLPNKSTDVTEKFWADYMKRGVCAIHGDMEHKWHDAGEGIRRCDYCGKIEHRRIEMRPVEIWEGV